MKMDYQHQPGQPLVSCMPGLDIQMLMLLMVPQELWWGVQKGTSCSIPPLASCPSCGVAAVAVGPTVTAAHAAAVVRQGAAHTCGLPECSLTKPFVEVIHQLE